VTQAHILLNFVTCYGSSWLHDEIDQTLTVAKLNLKIIAPDVSRATAGRLDDSIQLLDRLL
jgi:hypothetical protein